MTIPVPPQGAGSAGPPLRIRVFFGATDRASDRSLAWVRQRECFMLSAQPLVLDRSVVSRPPIAATYRQNVTATFHEILAPALELRCSNRRGPRPTSPAPPAGGSAIRGEGSPAACAIKSAAHCWAEGRSDPVHQGFVPAPRSDQPSRPNGWGSGFRRSGLGIRINFDEMLICVKVRLRAG
jgi:hypothetical protein